MPPVLKLSATQARLVAALMAKSSGLEELPVAKSGLVTAGRQLDLLPSS
jgi:hypothetical protein